MEDKALESLVVSVIREVLGNGSLKPEVPCTIESQDIKAGDPGPSEDEGVGAEEEVPDLSAVDFRKIISVPNPAHPDQFSELREHTSGRIGIWRAGSRYRTENYLRFRADHAAAMDAVSRDVPPSLLEEMNLFSVQTLCESKEEYLTRPDKGRMFSSEVLSLLRKKCRSNPDVQIIVADGLSSTAVIENLPDILPSILQGLEQEQIAAGTPFYVKYGRVPAMDPITETLGSKVTVILVGERPGLATRESMSAYMTYGGFVGISEAKRTVISNIYRGGTNPAEAGAFIAELCQRMLKEKASGLDLPI